MTRVCLVGDSDVDVRYELLSRETAREALSTYDLTQPFTNSLAVETVSLGAAVSLLNDLDWHLARYVRTAWVLEPSVDDTEYLSRDLATAVRNDRVDPATTDERLAIYGVVDDRPVDPLYTRRTNGSVPEYDLREVDDTVVVRVGETEFSS